MKNKDNYSIPLFIYEKFVYTIDDWHPNYDGNKVRVFMVNPKITKFVRIAAWGKDDYGLELNFEGTDEENEMVFNLWKNNIYDKIPEPCTIKYFESIGFTDV